MLHDVAILEQTKTIKSTRLAPVKILAPIHTTQHTVKKNIICMGIGVHSGESVTLRIKPAVADTGYVFIRTDLTENNRVPARWDTVADTSMCTKIANEAGTTVGTIEHLMAAFRALGVHNAIIELDGPEVPIMDGSSIEFIEAILASGGVKPLATPLKQIRVLKPIHVVQGKGEAWLLPSDEPRISIYFDGCGRFPQSWTFDYYPEKEDFTTLLSEARTFGFLEDGNKLRAMGLAQGADLCNTIVIDDNKVLNAEGLRFDDEFVRHKVLDAYGDLMLVGTRLLGHFDGRNSGHGLNNLILRALFADPNAWVYA
ncbi:UDP-3-O-acyl-N-acetylglucosamine deacetylase [Candidatus Paracaedibacter symbiosus]|uniref:UDP-3-O-acyl-N-acetylglucosamine deacetylase n=1 Tax=Candidatus Paracaedibacter symbiosus TaxID=244582 RepID=UPI000A05A4BD|nr:UDP-3-O-acyl-N-acetylglucosamine deacetylase [Candidatus Paracaedibacter symbiosus]